jgi:hypothetical protein
MTELTTCGRQNKELDSSHAANKLCESRGWQRLARQLCWSWLPAASTGPKRLISSAAVGQHVTHNLGTIRMVIDGRGESSGASFTEHATI